MVDFILHHGNDLLAVDNLSGVEVAAMSRQRTVFTRITPTCPSHSLMGPAPPSAPPISLLSCREGPPNWARFVVKMTW